MPPFSFFTIGSFSFASAAASRTFSSVISFLCSFSYASISLLRICPSFKPPCPSAASTLSQSRNPYFRITASRYFGLVSSPSVLPFNFRILSSFSSFLNHWLILFFACVLFTIFNQSRLGPLEFCDVIISTRSPFLISYSIGTSFPFTLAPTILFPTALCTLYAKSTVLEPRGRVFTSPAGLKQ